MAESAELESIRVGGVPEHFNYIFQLAEEKGIFKKFGVKVEFIIQKCGTGAMISSLKKGEQDVIVALTEGLVADIAKGGPIKLIGQYVQSSLCWAISAGINNNDIKTVSDLKDGTFAISRNGSGSHLMATVLASQKGWDPTKLKFKIVGAFKKLRDSVNAKETDAFMWETFTTKPFHDSKEIKRVGEIYTPWPCFMLAARDEDAKKRAPAYQNLIKALSEAATLFHSDSKEMVKRISKIYSLKVEDAKEWYSKVKINPTSKVPMDAVKKALTSLQTSKVLTEKQVESALSKQMLQAFTGL